MSFHCLMAHFFIELHNTPLSEWATVCSPAEGHLGFLQILDVIIKCYKYLCTDFYVSISSQLL